MASSSNYLQLISDFNLKPLSQFLSVFHSDLSLEIELAPFGQVRQSLFNVSENSDGIGIIWVLAESIIPSYLQALNLEDVSHKQCLLETRDFANAVLDFAKNKKFVFVASWSLPPNHRGYGLIDWHPQIGLSNLIAQMNMCLAEEFSRAKNVYMLDVARWFMSGQTVMAPKMWYAAKVPFTNSVFERAAMDCAAAIRAVIGQPLKLVVVDLDNTLWGGVIGETGWQGIRLGGHDHVGEAYKDFQRALLALSNRGVQLAIVSKNDESVALEALDKHPEMILRRIHFAGWRINWNDKAENLISLVQELNLGLSAVLFIDDNPVERDRISTALPDVTVPDWPIDPTAYVGALRSLSYFDVPKVTSEDRTRTSMYVADRERREVRTGSGSIEGWLRQLDTQISIRNVDSTNISRVTQLFNKTNQLNLSTRRLSEKELLSWLAKDGRSMFAVSASDKFGDMGLVGVIGVDVIGGRGVLVDFILSCRVMGRKVESAMLKVAAEEVIRLGGICLEATYIQTARNRPTLDIFRASNLEELSNYYFFTDSLELIACPDEVTIAHHKSSKVP